MLKMNKQYSFFIGRYQPLHEGHIAIIRKVLDEGKNVCIALKDIPKRETDPFNIQERINMFRDVFKDELDDGSMILMSVPDIEEVCYGRTVGWGMRQIEVDKEIEEISATKIREQLEREGKL